MDPMIARRTWRTVEPIHGMIYFSPEAAAGYEALGLSGRTGYFASRAAPMGAAWHAVLYLTSFQKAVLSVQARTVIKPRKISTQTPMRTRVFWAGSPIHCM